MSDAKYLHPSMTVYIDDQSVVSQSAKGQTLLFCPLFSFKGEDGQLRFVNSKSEYEDMYGDLDSAEYGQAPLNVVNWMENGGEALVMRLLPEDATLAHVILDFQTKKVNALKWVLNGEDVTRQINSETGSVEFVLPDGTIVYTEAELVSAGAAQVETSITILRPKIRQSPFGAADYAAIEAYCDTLQGSVSEDGYTHNILGYFYPNGRGANYYNNLYMKLSVEDAYDDTYSFRVYDIEIYEKDSSGSMNLIDGSFKVSFDPTATDLSNESMFIGDVLSKYAKEIKYVQCTEGFDSLGEALNDEIDPGLLDPFFLAERALLEGDSEYHIDNVLASTLTSLSEDANTGDTFVYVSDPETVYPGCEVLIQSAYKYTVDTVDRITGKVTLTTALTEDHFTADLFTTMAQAEYRQSGIESGADTTELILYELVDTFGFQKFYEGSAILKNALNEEFEVSIVSVDVDTNSVVIDQAATTEFAATILFQEHNDDVGASDDIDFDSYMSFEGGSEGTLNSTTKISLLADAYTGSINEDILLMKEYPIDVVLDANYDDAVKIACNTLASSLRQDLVFVADLGFTANPQQAIDKRTSIGFSNFYTSFFAQDFTIYDTDSGRDVKVTATYDLAGKIPYNDNNYGIYMPFVGPRRGVISGIDNLSWNPTDPWQERLYRKQVNYITKDPRRTMFFGQLTSQTVTSSLSDLSHVRTLLRLRRKVLELLEDYQFELITNETLTATNYALNAELKNNWQSTGAFEYIKGTVYASSYDKKQKQARVRIEMQFSAILERFIINLVVK